jgi:hypothetical protein
MNIDSDQNADDINKTKSVHDRLIDFGCLASFAVW